MRTALILSLLLAILISACSPQPAPEAPIAERVSSPSLAITPSESTARSKPSPTATKQTNPSASPVVPMPTKTEELAQQGAQLPPNDQIWLTNGRDFILFDPQASPMPLPAPSIFHVVSPDGNTVAFVNKDGDTPRTRIVVSQRHTSHEIELPDTVISLVFAPTSDRFAFSTLNSVGAWSIYIYDLRDHTFQEIASLTNPSEEEPPLLDLLQWNERGIIIQRRFLAADTSSTAIELFDPVTALFTPLYEGRSSVAVSSRDGDFSLIRTGTSFGEDGEFDYGLLLLNSVTGEQTVLQERGPLLFYDMSFSPDNKIYFYTYSSLSKKEEKTLNLKSVTGEINKSLYFSHATPEGSLSHVRWLDNQHLLLAFRTEQSYDVYSLPIDQFDLTKLILLASIPNPEAGLLEVMYVPVSQP